MNRAILSIVILAAAAGVLLSYSPSFSGGTLQDAGGTVSEPEPPIDGAVPALAGTAWRLVSFQSMDDAVGEIWPDDPSVFTMRLNRDGTVVFRLDCNRARGTWSAEPASDGTSGRIKFGPLASTRALCPPPQLDDRIVADAAFVRSYLFRQGRLYLSLMADGGIYEWEPFEAPMSGK